MADFAHDPPSGVYQHRSLFASLARISSLIEPPGQQNVDLWAEETKHAPRVEKKMYVGFGEKNLCRITQHNLLHEKTH